MNGFQQAETIGRGYFESWLKDLEADNIQFVSKKYERVDCNFSYMGKNITAEIKVRDSKYKDYNTHIIEVNKLKAIEEYMQNNNKDIGLYVNFFGENVVYIYNVKDINKSDKFSKRLKATTVVNNGYKDKQIIEIPKDIGQCYIRLNNTSKWFATT